MGVSIQIGTDKSNLAVISHGFPIPGPFGGDEILIRNPTYSVYILAVYPAVKTGIILINRVLNALGFIGEIVQYLTVRKGFFDHVVDHVAC